MGGRQYGGRLATIFSPENKAIEEFFEIQYVCKQLSLPPG
jgi:hypothetical protein